MGKFNSYLINEDAKTEFYETAAMIGVVCDGNLMKDIEKFITSAQEESDITYMHDRLKEQLKGGYDWSSQGVGIINGLKPLSKKGDLQWLLDACALAKGMKKFMDEIGKKVVGSKPTFIHSRINDYYKAEKAALGDIKGAKANTADCIIMNKGSVDDVINGMKTGPVTPDKELTYINLPDGMKILQVSLKKSEKGAQLGKITTFLKTNLGYGDDTKTAVNVITEENMKYLVGEGIWDKIKSFASGVWDKLKGYVNKTVSKIKDKYLKIFKGKPKQEHIRAFFSEIGIPESMYNDNTIDMLCEGGINAPTQAIIDKISENPAASITAVNKAYKELQQLVSENDLIGTKWGKSLPIVKQFKGVPSTEVFSLISNYLTIKTLQDMVRDERDISTTVKRLVAEMMFGGTKLPLWKVYGDYGDGHAYVYLGTIDTFIDAGGEVGDKKIEVLGIRVNTSGEHYTIATAMLEKVDDAGKSYVFLRTGTNSSSRITFVFEGTKIVGPISMDKSVKTILGK